MKKKLFLSMFAIILMTMVLLFGLLGVLFQCRLSGQVKEGLKSLRVTVISQEGEVLFDNYREGLENHSNRPEVIEAKEHGVGESQRFSETLGKATYYYAINMSDGKILRLSITIDTIYSWLYQLIPMAAICIVAALGVSMLLAGQLTKKLVEPINSINPDNISELSSEFGKELFYEELTPFIKKIETQRTEIKSQLLTLESRTRTINQIAENIKEGLIIVDKGGVVLFSSKSTENIFGQQEIIGKNFLYVTRNVDFLNKAKESLGGQSGEMVLEHKGDVYNVYFSPAAVESEVNGAIILLVDITDKFAAEKQRKQFSANVSHELKTPLTTISALSEMIGNDMVKPEDIRGFSKKINAQAKRLITLIEDIIRLSEFDESKIESEKEEFDLEEVISAVAENLTPMAAIKAVTLEVEQSPLQISGNRGLIEELIFNLVDNAIKYNKPGGSVRITAFPDNEYIKIKVSDTGIGISQEHIHRIFERFYRVDKSRSKRTGGTGLGLSIVKHIAELHGGRVEIQSEPKVRTEIICHIKQNKL